MPLCAAAVIAASAIAHSTGGAGAGAPAVVSVGDGPGAVATGFAVSPGRVVTVAHVLEGDAVTVRGADGVARRAAVVRRDDALDLALLAVDGLPRGHGVVPAGTRVLVQRDGAVAALPARVVRRITARVRTASTGAVTSRPALELAADPAAGDSGAPVFSGGRVTGLVFARSREQSGVAYAVDATALAALLR